MLPPVIYLYPNNTQVIQVTEVKDEITGQYLTAASVTATLYNSRGQPDPVLQNIVMTYVPGTNATYNGFVPSTFNPAGYNPGYGLQASSGGYVLVITAIQAGVQAQWSIPAVIQQRKQ